MDNDESSNLTTTETGCDTDENRENPTNLTSKLTENDENLENVISKSSLTSLSIKLSLTFDYPKQKKLFHFS